MEDRRKDKGRGDEPARTGSGAEGRDGKEVVDERVRGRERERTERKSGSKAMSYLDQSQRDLF